MDRVVSIAFCLLSETYITLRLIFAGHMIKCVGRYIVVGVLFTSLASCEYNEEEESKTLLNRGINGDPDSLHPHVFSSNDAATVLRDLREGLVTTSSNGKYEGGAAESWSVSADGLEYNFVLRKNLQWSNGDDLTADDFVYSLKALVAPETASPNANMLNAVRNAEAIMSGELPSSELGVYSHDESQVRIMLTKPTPYFYQVLAHPSTYPVHVGTEDENVNSTAERGSVTNGAYKLSGRVLGSTISVTRNQRYWNDARTSIDSVTFHVVGESQEVRRYEAGDLQITDSVSKDSFERVSLERPDELRISPMLGLYFVGLNLTEPPFDADRRVRQALSLAIDREALVNKVLGRGELPAYSIVPPGVLNFSYSEKNIALLSQIERNSLARKLLGEAGYSADRPLNFEFRYSLGGGHEKIALALQSMWETELDVNVKLVGEEFKVFISNLQSKNEIEAFRLGWTGDFNDPYAFLKIFESDSSMNFTGFENNDVDSFLELASESLDLTERSRLHVKAEELILQAAPILPVYFYVSKHLVHPSVKGWENNILDIHPSKHLSIGEAAH